MEAKKTEYFKKEENVVWNAADEYQMMAENGPLNWQCGGHWKSWQGQLQHSSAGKKPDQSGFKTKQETDPSQDISKNNTGGNTSWIILWGPYYSDTKTRQRHHKKTTHQ